MISIYDKINELWNDLYEECCNKSLDEIGSPGSLKSNIYYTNIGKLLALKEVLSLFELEANEDRDI